MNCSEYSVASPTDLYISLLILLPVLQLYDLAKKVLDFPLSVKKILRILLPSYIVMFIAFTLCELICALNILAIGSINFMKFEFCLTVSVQCFKNKIKYEVKHLLNQLN